MTHAFPPKTTFLGFIFRMMAFFGVPYALIHVLPLGFLLEGIAAIESYFLNASGVASSVIGAVLSANTAWFQIVPDCSGLIMVFLLAGLLWSTPVRQPIRYFWVFAPALFLWNLVRLFVVLYVGGVWGQTAQEFIHIALWFIDAGLVLFLWWVAFAVGTPTTHFKRMKPTRKKPPKNRIKHL